MMINCCCLIERCGSMINHFHGIKKILLVFVVCPHTYISYMTQHDLLPKIFRCIALFKINKGSFWQIVCTVQSVPGTSTSFVQGSKIKVYFFLWFFYYTLSIIVYWFRCHILYVCYFWHTLRRISTSLFLLSIAWSQGYAVSQISVKGLIYKKDQ